MSFGKRMVAHYCLSNSVVMRFLCARGWNIAVSVMEREPTSQGNIVTDVDIGYAVAFDRKGSLEENTFVTREYRRASCREE